MLRRFPKPNLRNPVHRHEMNALFQILTSVACLVVRLVHFAEMNPEGTFVRVSTVEKIDPSFLIKVVWNAVGKSQVIL